MVYLRVSPTLGRYHGWRTLKSPALSPLPSALPLPLPQSRFGEEFSRERAGAEVAAVGRGESGDPPSQFTGTRRFGSFPRLRGLAFASSPIYFPFLHGLLLNVNFAANQPPQSRFSLPHSRGGAREGAEVGRNASERLGLEADFPFGGCSDHVLKPYFCWASSSPPRTWGESVLLPGQQRAFSVSEDLL